MNNFVMNLQCFLFQSISFVWQSFDDYEVVSQLQAIFRVWSDFIIRGLRISKF